MTEEIVVPQRQRPGKYRTLAGMALVGEILMGDPVLHTWTARQVGEIAKRVAFGVSSKAMVRCAIYGWDPTLADYPRDWDDLERCEIVHALAPSVLAEKMTPTLKKFRESVEKGCTIHDAPPKPDQFWSPRLPRPFEVPEAVLDQMPAIKVLLRQSADRMVLDEWSTAQKIDCLCDGGVQLSWPRSVAEWVMS